MDNNEGSGVVGHSVRNKNKLLLILVIALLAALAVVAKTSPQLLGLNKQLDSRSTFASCYGYGCPVSSVSIAARPYLPSYGYNNPFSYGTLNVPSGQRIELTWSAIGVDYCVAGPDTWTTNKSTYLPPTQYNLPITVNRVFSVFCYQNKNKNPIAYSSVYINVVGETPGLQANKDITSPVGQVTAGQKNVTYTVLNLGATTSINVNLSSAVIIADTPNFTKNVNKVYVYDGDALIGQATTSKMPSNATAVAVNFTSPFVINGFSLKKMRIAVDLSPTASGTMGLGISGFGYLHNSLNITGLPAYGNVLTIVKDKGKSK